MSSGKVTTGPRFAFAGNEVDTRDVFSVIATRDYGEKRMATTHAPSTGVAPDRGKRGRQVTIVAAVALALAAVVVP